MNPMSRALSLPAVVAPEPDDRPESGLREMVRGSGGELFGEVVFLELFEHRRGDEVVIAHYRDDVFTLHHGFEHSDRVVPAVDGVAEKIQRVGLTEADFL